MSTENDYMEKFDRSIPAPYGVPNNQIVAELAAAIKKGEPIPAGFNWYKGMPAGANS